MIFHHLEFVHQQVDIVEGRRGCTVNSVNGECFTLSSTAEMRAFAQILIEIAERKDVDKESLY